MTLHYELAGRPVAVVGLGQIGMSWTAYFLARGLSVRATDPDPAAFSRTRDYVAQAWPVLAELGLVVEGADASAIGFYATVGEAAQGCGFAQENGPENEELKIRLLAEIDAALPVDAVLASSTSALPMSVMQSACLHPERCVTAHPFNPPHLVPLVELVGGRKTGLAALDAAQQFYLSIRREPIRIQREVYGHVANRLQYVLFNEAARLVLEGVVSVEDVDRAVNWGPGMRWPLLGPFMTFHMAGGEQGIAGAFAKFGPRDAMSTDRVTRIQPGIEQRQVLAEGASIAQRGRGMQDLEAERDRFLADLYKLRTRKTDCAP